MNKIELTVHEFMTIMGTLDEKFGGRQAAAGSSIYAAWHEQWRALEARLEKLGLMERADMLFDGKVAINALSEQHFRAWSRRALIATCRAKRDSCPLWWTESEDAWNRQSLKR